MKKALRLLSDNGGPLPLNDDVLAKLKEKHPPKQEPNPSAIIDTELSFEEVHPIIFEQIDGKLIHDVILRMDGAAGPSGLDANSWKRVCSSFGLPSSDLCATVASVTKRMCTTFVDPNSLSALVACQLIALDKCPGVRPIGIGETLRKIIT